MHYCDDDICNVMEWRTNCRHNTAAKTRMATALNVMATKMKCVRDRQCEMHADTVWWMCDGCKIRFFFFFLFSYFSWKMISYAYAEKQRQMRMTGKSRGYNGMRSIPKCKMHNQCLVVLFGPILKFNNKQFEALKMTMLSGGSTKE